MKKTLFTAIAVAFLTGCATNDYALYADTQKAIAQARAVSETARYNALAEIAKQGDTAAKVAAVLSIQMGNGTSNNQNVQTVNPPKTFGDTALQWTSILLPSITQVYGISQNARTAIKQSDNATAASIAQSNNQATIAASTNQAFANIASQIQAPQANVTTTTTNTDSSNRSTTTNTDSSNRSSTTTTTNTTTTTTDSSNRPTTTNNNSNNTGTTGTGGP